MKKLFFFLPAMIAAFVASAQTADTVFEYKVPFQVPDNPAFKAMDIDPSNILRPTDLKTFAFTLAPYVGKQGLALPRNFALEFSPGRVASKYWTVTDYENKKWKRIAYNVSFTMATRFDEGEEEDPFRIGFGAHYQCGLKKDDPVLNKSLYASQDQFLQARSTLVKAYAKTTGVQATSSYSKSIESPRNAADSALLAQFITWLDGSAFPDSLKNIRNRYNVNRFEVTLEKYEAAHWNDFRFVLAAAWVGQSRDSGFQDVQYNLMNYWMTFAFRPGARATHSQVLLGIFVRHSVDPDSLGLVSTLAFSARYYYGDAKVRGFAETQYKWNGYKERSPASDQSLLINFGLEAKLGGKLGVFASAGVENFFDPGDPWSKLRSSLNLRYFLE